MRFRRLTSYFLLTLPMLACGGVPSLERFTPPDADRRSRDYLSQFVRYQIDSVADRLVPTLRTPESATELRKIGDLVRNERFDTIRVVGAQTNVVNSIRHVNLTYELHSSSGWYIANVATVDTADTWLVEGVSARGIPQSLEVAAAFSLEGKSALHYLWLVLTALCASFSIGTALFIATRRAMPRRWRWVLFSLLGFGTFQLNWATGATYIALFHVQLLSAGFVRAGAAAPWILSFAVPIGALVGLARYRRWRLAPAPSSVDPAPSTEAAV